MSVELLTPTRKQLGDFATLTFQGLVTALDSRLPQPLVFVEASLEEEAPDSLAAHFASTGARVDLRAGDLDGAPFACLLDQRASHLLAGSLVPLLDEDLCVLIQSGNTTDELKAALETVAGAIAEALGATLAGMGLSGELTVESARFADALLDADGDDATRLRGLLDYRGVRLLLLLELPPLLLDKLIASSTE